MDISSGLKQATALAKEKKFDLAIELLMKLLPAMAIQGGFPHSAYTKIVPYFQKAGRYAEVEEYCNNFLFTLIKKECKNTFGHQSSETINAFINLHSSMVYDKLRLCAKREKQSADIVRFTKSQTAFYELYEAWLIKEHGET